MHIHAHLWALQTVAWGIASCTLGTCFCRLSTDGLPSKAMYLTDLTDLTECARAPICYRLVTDLIPILPSVPQLTDLTECAPVTDFTPISYRVSIGRWQRRAQPLVQQALTGQRTALRASRRGRGKTRGEGRAKAGSSGTHEAQRRETPRCYAARHNG